MIRRLLRWLWGRPPEVTAEITAVVERIPDRPGQRRFYVEVSHKCVNAASIFKSPHIPKVGSRMVCTGVGVKEIDPTLWSVTCTYEKEPKP